MYQFAIDNIQFYPNNPLVLIAGPCVIESRDHCLLMAEKLKQISRDCAIPLIFKSSFLKANRSSVNSFVGPGLAEGLNILAAVKHQFSLPVLSDVHSLEQIKPAAEVLDVLQIPAFLCRQTDLIVAAAETDKIINVKKGQFLAPEDVKHIADKVYSTGNKNLLITERGTTFGYHNLVADMRSLEIIKSLKIPIVFDATHSVQLPGAAGDRSGGQREFVSVLSRAAVAVGINAIFLEVHDAPERAKSDGPNMLSLEELKQLLPLLQKIDALIKSGY